MAGGRPTKALIAHVLDATWKPSRHAVLLRTEALPPDCPLDDVPARATEAWGRLRELAAAYREAAQPVSRQRVALEFAAAIRAFHDALDAGDVPPELKMYAVLGPPMMRSGIAEAFEEWEREHGLTFRAQAGCLTPSDEWVLEHGGTIADDPAPPPPGFEQYVPA